MKCIFDEEINRIRNEMHALIDDGYEKNYDKILKLSKKLDTVLNKALSIKTCTSQLTGKNIVNR